MPTATLAEMQTLHRLLVLDLIKRLDPKTRAKRPGIDTLAVVARMVAQEGISASNPRRKAEANRLEKLYMGAVLQGMAENPTPTFVKEAGKLLRMTKNSPAALIPALPTEPLPGDDLAGITLPFD